VITGKGDLAFCAGADLKAVARGESIAPPGTRAWGFAGWARHYIDKPTIAAVNGPALGGGAEIVLACDLAVAVQSATFGFPEVRRGIVADSGGAFRLPAQLPPKLASEMLLTGASIDAATALRYGLVNRVVSDGHALDAALELACGICQNAPLAVRATKRIAYGVTGATWGGESHPWLLTKVERDRVHRSGDAKEGPQAFAENRAPVWQGR
jgi:crotonobetainyl-CoA hydratase